MSWTRISNADSLTAHFPDAHVIFMCFLWSYQEGKHTVVDAEVLLFSAILHMGQDFDMIGIVHIRIPVKSNKLKQ